MADSAIAQLQATALTARCHNAFFRQKQLKALHDGLRQGSSALKNALKADTRVSEQEATTEVALSLELVKEHYASINTAKELEDEYRIANGKDASDQTKPWGVVYIEPQQTHTPLYSVITALTAALAAGNCVALKLENSLRSLPTLLRTLLVHALEPDTFAIVSSTPSQETLSTCLQVLQETQVEQPSYAQLVSPQHKVIAIVDRAADLASAAKHLVTARFAFGGSSPYAPDLIFVNEYVKKEFLEHVLKFALPYLTPSEATSSNNPPQSSPPSTQNKPSLTTSTLESLSSSKSWHTTILTSTPTGALIDLTSPTTLPPKCLVPILSTTSITSLEHAISLLDTSPTPLLAGYYFGTPGAGKYLAQFIPSALSIVNHVPLPLLLGPAAPSHLPAIIEGRYTRVQFSTSTPAFITPSSSHESLVRVLGGEEGKARERLEKAGEEIKEGKRAEWIAIGYFEQGILIGLGVYGVPLLACVGMGVWVGVRAGLRRWAFV